jgi:hypothetical protein
MAKGQVVEQGSHDELVALNGAYARLVKTQDLSKGGDGAQDSDEDDDVMKMEKGEDLDKVLTQASANGEAVLGADPSMQKQKMFGLIPGMYMMFREQPRLWKHLASIIFWSTLGGKPSQSIPIVPVGIHCFKLLTLVPQVAHSQLWPCSLQRPWRPSRPWMSPGTTSSPSCSSLLLLETLSPISPSAGLRISLDR